MELNQEEIKKARSNHSPLAGESKQALIASVGGQNLKNEKDIKFFDPSQNLTAQDFTHPQREGNSFSADSQMLDQRKSEKKEIGGRKFILVQLLEKINQKKSLQAYKFVADLMQKRGDENKPPVISEITIMDAAIF